MSELIKQQVLKSSMIYICRACHYRTQLLCRRQNALPSAFPRARQRNALGKAAFGWTVGKIFLCRGPGTRKILAVGKGGRRDGGYLLLAFAERPAVWRSAKIFLFF
jgi:hypothetical protein